MSGVSDPKPRRPGHSTKGAFRIVSASDDEILRHVVRAYREIGDARFTVNGYQRWRRGVIESEDEPVPSHRQLVARYGSLTEALHRAVPDAPRRGLRAGAPMRAAIDSAAARRAVPNAGEHALKAERGPRETAAPVPADSTGRIGLLLAMAGELSHHELLDFLRAARGVLEKPATLAAARRVQLLRPLASLLEEHPASSTAPAATVERKLYDQRRPKDAPTSERLVRAYGSWAGACRAAAGVTADGRRTRVGTVASRHAYGPRPAPYTRDEAIAAVLACSVALRRTPSSRDYHEWSLSVRANARRGGQAVRLPHYGALVRLFKRRSGESTWSAVLRSL